MSVPKYDGYYSGVPYNEVVFTPEGFKLADDIKIGDFVFDGNGDSCRVKGVVKDRLETWYSVTLSDGLENKMTAYQIVSYRAKSSKYKIWKVDRLERLWLMHKDSVRSLVKLADGKFANFEKISRCDTDDRINSVRIFIDSSCNEIMVGPSKILCKCQL